MVKPRTKVLVVDDDPVVLEVTKMRLTKAGYDVVTREDAVGTSTAVAQENPEIVLLDVSMPGISGEALAKLITQSHKRHSVAVIFHSTRDAVELQRLAQDCGALGAIQKTSSSSLFRIQFERLLLSRRAQGIGGPASGPVTPRTANRGVEEPASARKKQ